ncbi:MAG: adenosylcobinamide-GDP ribazoletransferase [Paracoccus sp. (in: a-proteobacteria)]|nr:adenosylcobinamide-GDP ribazoletransferase [Paracoccus sp. (in: a-proteobacteria)]MDO5646360.1 adenosylcobinamide-GDP ribazoletransferase [Paracoccus sp. (in: a-proteobacteria)]
MIARWHQAVLALVLLTRLPLAGLLPARTIPLAGAAWAFPLAGVVVGGLGAGVMAVVPLPPMIAAMLAVAAMIAITGALHEDGLADFTDAAGGHNREQRLEIMRDSRIGSYGVLALILAVGLRVAMLAALPSAALWLVVGVAVASRAGMVAVMRLPAARADGMGHTAGRPSRRAVIVALTIGAAALIATAELAGQPLAALSLIGIIAAAALTAYHAYQKLGGQTGDVLGTTQQLCEISGMLIVLCVCQTP